MNNPAVAAILALVMPAAALAATTTTVVDVPSGNGTQRFLYVRPDAPIANIVSVPGGDGRYGVQADGSMPTLTATCGPFSRNMHAYAAQGFSVALVDAHSSGTVYDFNHIHEVIRHMRARDNVPTWVVGGSASTNVIAGLAANLPASDPVGAIFFAPQTPSSIVSSIRRPSLVVHHTGDPSAFGVRYYNALTSATVRERVPLSGGTSGMCGFHLFDGLDAEFIAATTSFMRRQDDFGLVVGANYQGLWYRAPADSEAGWGVNVTQQGDVLFATWFTYDADGGQMWLVAPAVRRTTGNTFTGDLYRTTGPAFDSVPFDSARVAATVVGTATFSFTDGANGQFDATVNGIPSSKPITRQLFSPTATTCTAGGAPGATPNFQDLWYRAPAESEPGWGVNLAHQGDVLFATWFTYEASGRGIWLVGPALRRTTGNTFTGALYRTSGPAFNANPWNPSGVGVTEVGSATFAFSDAANGTFTYTVNTTTQTKAITRQVFGSPATVCR